MKKTKTPPTPKVVNTYETEIEFDCPVRGKIKQKVKVKRYESMEPPAPAEEVLPKKSITEKLDRQFSGLIICDDSLDDEGQEDEAV